MVDSTSQGEESFVTIRDVGFNLLRRHTRIKGRNDDDRDIHLRKEVYGHTGHGRDADYHHEETHHEDEEGILDGEG
jgi:hypothetical protein